VSRPREASDGDELLEAMLCFRVFASMTLLRLDGV